MSRLSQPHLGASAFHHQEVPKSAREPPNPFLARIMEQTIRQREIAFQSRCQKAMLTECRFGQLTNASKSKYSLGNCNAKHSHDLQIQFHRPCRRYRSGLIRFNRCDPVFYKNDLLVSGGNSINVRISKSASEIGPVTASLRDSITRAPLFNSGWGMPGAETISGMGRNVNTTLRNGPSWITDIYGATTSLDLSIASFKHTQLLNEAIPAMSLAVGANYTARFGDSKNYDMPSLYASGSHWPSARGSNASGVPSWHHSDMREVAYIYLYQFFDKLATLSN